MSERSTDTKDEHERRDRQMLELLNELRVALPGVQILFAFLLTVPFSAGFERTTAFQRDVLFATLMLTALSTTCLIAPSAAHRLRFHQGDGIPLHRNADLDVAIIVITGQGLVTIDQAQERVEPGSVVVIPRGAERSITALSREFAYLTCHQRRAGLQPTMPASRQPDRTSEEQE